MATQLFLRSYPSDITDGTNPTVNLEMHTTRGAASTTVDISTTAVPDLDSGLRWYSPPMAAQTLTGTVTVNIRGLENNAQANATAGIVISKVGTNGIVNATILASQQIPTTASEYTTADAAKTQASIAVPSTVFAAGERILVQIRARGLTGANMGAGRIVTNSYNGPTAGAIGDTYVTFSQNLTFTPATRSGADTASAVDSGSRKIPGATYLPPTIVSTTNLTEGTGTRSFASIAVQAGDWVVVQAIGDELIGGFTVSATGWTFTKQVENSEFGIGVQTVHTVFADTSTSKTITVTPADGTASYRAVATVVRGSDGPGVSTAGPGQDRQITPSETGSAIFIGITDGDGGSVGGGLTWYNGGQTVVASANVGIQNYIFGRDNDSGDPAAAQFQGISVPTFNTPSITLFEMLGFPDTAPAATQKSGSDTGSGTDAGTLAVALTPATDAESGVDAATLLASQTRAETSSAVDAATLTTLTPKSGSDTALAVDAGTLVASFTGSDLGGSADAPSGPLSATLAGADTGAMGTEAWQLSVVLQSAETGAGTDAGSVAQGATDKSGSDTATAVDTATLAASQTRADTAGAADVATLVATFTASELSSIVDTVQALAATFTGADTSSQTESQTLNAGGTVSGSDTSSTTEGRTLNVTLTGADTSAVTENQSVLPTIPQSGSDTAGLTAENRTLAVQLTASEIVTAIEGFTLSAGGNFAGADTGTVQESILLTVSVSRGDTVMSLDQGFLTLFKSGAETSTLVDSASLLAQLTVADIVAAAEVLAVLTGPQSWEFISADLRALSSNEASSVTSGGVSGNSTTSNGVSGGTSISVTISW